MNCFLVLSCIFSINAPFSPKVLLPHLKEKIMHKTNRQTDIRKAWQTWHSREWHFQTRAHTVTMGAIAKARWWQDGFWRWMEDNSSNGSRRSQAGSSCNQTASIWTPVLSIRPNDERIPFFRSRGAPALCLESTAFRIYGSYGRSNALVVFTDHRFSPAPAPRPSLLLWSQSKYYFPEGDIVQFIITMVSGLNLRWRRDGGCAWSIALSCPRKLRSAPLRIN